MPMVTRRQFLAGLGAVSVAAVLPLKLLPQAKIIIDPKAEYFKAAANYYEQLCVYGHSPAMLILEDLRESNKKMGQIMRKDMAYHDLFN